MARTALTPLTLPGSYTGAVAALTFAAIDVTNGNKFALQQGDILVIQNTHASSQTVTLTSLADRFGRTGTFTSAAIAAGTFAVFGPIQSEGWYQADGQFYLTASDVAVKVAILRAP